MLRRSGLIEKCGQYYPIDSLVFKFKRNNLLGILSFQFYFMYIIKYSHHLTLCEKVRSTIVKVLDFRH